MKKELFKTFFNIFAVRKKRLHPNHVVPYEQAEN